MLISIDIYITCDFPGGGGSGPLSSLLDPHMTVGSCSRAKFYTLKIYCIMWR